MRGQRLAAQCETPSARASVRAPESGGDPADRLRRGADSLAGRGVGVPSAFAKAILARSATQCGREVDLYRLVSCSRVFASGARSGSWRPLGAARPIFRTER